MLKLSLGTLLLQLGDVGKKLNISRDESEDSLLLAASAAQHISSVTGTICFKPDTFRILYIIFYMYIYFFFIFIYIFYFSK